ncbi:TonB-dependent receptor [Marinifilum flexuosum]|uniref:Hemoglobin/transferrin/lactoferrin receptor protein n=1 Tax=Marinifilum flexuosum TaxID=1117708 RepID=A0A419X914_9BACT|nr:TonB-dependent receptor [Marinifilum flexuosum]RKE04243.1 hemoglobin/transferrin/lactoferrin receptor protein [Marinifilum flexuosum]
MFRLLSSFLLVLIANLSFSQQIKVVDKESNKPIENVYIFDNYNSILTNELGIADLSEFKEKRLLHFQHPSYQNLEKDFNDIKLQNFIVKLHSNIFPIQEVVVSANKWEQNIKEVPLKVHKIDKAEISNTNSQTTADLLKSCNQVYIQKSQLGGGSPMIRGFAANRVLLVLDGVRLNNAIYRSGNLQNVISIDANSLESAEVILGPGSIIYGSDAIGGVMDFHTIKPLYSTSGKTNTKLRYKNRYSSANNEVMNHVSYNIGKERLSYAGSVTYSDFDDQKMGSHGPDEYLRNEYVIIDNGTDKIITNSEPKSQKQSGYNQFNLVQKIRYKASENTDLLYGFHYTTSSDIPRYDRLIQYKGDNLKYAEWYYGPQTLQMHNFQITLKKAKLLYDSFRLTTAFQNYKESRHDRKFSSAIKRNRSEKLKIYIINADAEKKLTKSTHLFWGAEMTHNRLRSTGHSTNIETNTFEEIASRYPDKSKYSTLAFYSNIKHKLNSNWTLNTGIRYSHIWISSELDNTYYNFPFTNLDLSTGSLNGGLGVTYNSDSGWDLKFNASSGFRAPNIDDIGKIFDSEPGKVVVPNKDLKPEYIYNLDFNVSKNFNQKFFIDINAFYSFLDDAMIRSDYSFDGHHTIIYDDTESEVQAIVNADNAKVWGVNFQCIAKINQNFSATANMNYNNGEYKDGSPVRHIAPMFGSFKLDYKSNKLSSNIALEYNAKIAYNDLAEVEKDKAYLYAQDKNGNPYSPEWLIVSWNNNYKLTNSINLNFSIENIFNKRYRPYSSGIAGVGRNFIMGVDINLK